MKNFLNRKLSMLYIVSTMLFWIIGGLIYGILAYDSCVDFMRQLVYTVGLSLSLLLCFILNSQNDDDDEKVENESKNI